MSCMPPQRCPEHTSICSQPSPQLEPTGNLNLSNGSFLCQTLLPPSPGFRLTDTATEQRSYSHELSGKASTANKNCSFPVQLRREIQRGNLS